MYGISESEFWNMTISELERAVKAKKKIHENERRETAIENYRLADLIGRSVARIYNKSNQMPEIYEVYPELFDKEEAEERKAAKKEEKFALELRQFANAHNRKICGGGKQK